MEASRPPHRGVITQALGISLTIHAACAAILILLAARIEKTHLVSHAEYLKVSLLREIAPPPEPPPIAANPPHEETRLPPHRIRHRPVHVEVKPPSEPEPASTPDVQAVPDATSSTGAVPVPSGSGAGTSMDAPAQGLGDSSGSGDIDAPVAANTVAHPPEIVTYVVPEYPRMARARGIEGRVLLKLIVDESGKVEDDIKILDSIPMLDQAALDAIHRWRFTPGRDADGNPVRVLLEVPVRFTLR